MLPIQHMIDGTGSVGVMLFHGETALMLEEPIKDIGSLA
jgi:hypothetical protein